MSHKLIHSALFGVAVGDALGVPVEFRDRVYLKSNPVTDMLAYGTHNQPAGTWSDDSSLTFCLADMLLHGYNLKKLAKNFIDWYRGDFWTPHGEVFDVGNATSSAINRLQEGVNPLMAGGADESDNGNGSLMRILPLVFYVNGMPVEQRFKCVSDVSSLTHRHIRSVLGCFIYIEFALQLMTGVDKFEAFRQARVIVNDFLNNNPICSGREINRYHRVLQNQVDVVSEVKLINGYAEAEIASSGYVVHSLEAAVWCLLNETGFEATVLKAVNLGSDTDTTAAIAGGLAGILYGFPAIPQKWINQLARKDDIFDLCERLENKI